MNKLLQLKRFVTASDTVSASNCNIRLFSFRRIKPISCRRTKRNNDVLIEEVGADQLKYNGGKKGQMVIKSGIENALRNVGLSQKQFIEQDPLSEEDKDDFEEVILRGEEFYDMHTSAIRTRKNLVEKKRTIRKYFREPPETNLLTAAAKEQIKYLHSLDPVQWDAEKLSESFPISIDGVKKLLRSRFVPKSVERQQRHDSSVARNIKCLKEGKEGISSKTRQLFKEGKLKLEHSVGNANLPMPSCNEIQKSVQLQTSQYPERIGQFLSIVKPYLDLKAKELTASSTVSQSATDGNFQDHKKENLWQVTVNSTRQNSEDNSDDPLCYSYLARKVSKSNPDITFESMQKNAMKDAKGSDYMQTSKNYIDTKIEPINSDSINNEYVPKYSNEKVELSIDCKSEGLNREVYLYDSKLGYQHPLGKPTEYPDKIIIPHHLYKTGCKYKVGNCYYDDEGNFLYRTFV